MGKMNQFLLLFLASCFFFISHSQTTSNTSSQHHCLPDQSHTLLQLRQEFVQKRLHSDSDFYDLNDYYNGSYPKMKSWKADSDCCSWDGVTCDPENGHVVGLNLTNSWLNGRLNSNSSLFSLRHLHRTQPCPQQLHFLHNPISIWPPCKFDPSQSLFFLLIRPNPVGNFMAIQFGFT
uniref:Leucine-rich repeat-containing N-terminal plant-type domain-containing protein n=1 Tax=Fagus sylvatica TaxID=28930 RepID=A0A2N9IBG8_FAGSY